MNAPADPHFATRIRESFARQKAMALIGARLGVVDPGAVEIELPFRDDLTQQKGFVHGGIIGMIADTACGYAAYSLIAGRLLARHRRIQDEHPRARHPFARRSR